MTDVTASRTLVKSPPELWTECSQAESLARHLDSFGEIRITRLEPESTVAWEGELASGTVRLEPSGWGTRVVLTATPTPPPVAVEVPDVTDPPEETDAAIGTLADAPPAPQGGRRERERGLGAWLRRLFGRRSRAEEVPAGVAEPEPEPQPEPELPEASEPSAVCEPEPTVSPDVDAEAALGAALDSLGRAHHRPFSRV